MHEQLIRTDYVGTEEPAASRARAARGGSALLAFLALSGALALAHFAQLRAHALAFGSALLAQPFTLDPLFFAGLALRRPRFESRLPRCFAARSFGLLGSRLFAAAIDARFTPRVLELRLHHFAGDSTQISYQTVDQTTTLTLEMIHLFPFRVSHGTTAAVKTNTPYEIPKALGTERTFARDARWGVLRRNVARREHALSST